MPFDLSDRLCGRQCSVLGKKRVLVPQHNNRSIIQVCICECPITAPAPVRTVPLLSLMAHVLGNRLKLQHESDSGISRFLPYALRDCPGTPVLIDIPPVSSKLEEETKASKVAGFQAGRCHVFVSGSRFSVYSVNFCQRMASRTSQTICDKLSHRVEKKEHSRIVLDALTSLRDTETSSKERREEQAVR